MERQVSRFFAVVTFVHGPHVTAVRQTRNVYGVRGRARPKQQPVVRIQRQIVQIVRVTVVPDKDVRVRPVLVAAFNRLRFTVDL